MAMRNWLREQSLASAIVSGGDITGEVHRLILQGENPRSGLHWLCLTMALLKALFLRARNFFSVKTYDL